MRKINIKRGVPIKVMWNDPAMIAGWVRNPTDVQPAVCVTRAFCAGTDERNLYLTHTIADDGSFMGLTALPWGAVRKVQVEKK